MVNPQSNSGVYTLGQLEQLGHSLARRHGVIKPGQSDVLLPRLRQNEDVLRNTYKLVTASIREGHKITPAGEWLLDNFHVIEEQIKTSKIHLPRRYSHELPVIDDIEWKTKPRVFIIARELINHTDGRLDITALRGIVAAYQEHKTLRIGELWAFPIMLRLGLIDNLRQIAESIATGFIDQRIAKFWAEKISHASRHDPHHLIAEIGDLARSEPRLSSMFVSEFARRIHNHCHSPSMPLSWIEQRLNDAGLTIEQQQFLASQAQAHDQMSMSNSISSLRFLNETDWRDFVEDMSGVDAILRQDPAGIYPHMDFATRDSYRHVIEYAARYSQYEEHDVAKIALAMTESTVDPSLTGKSVKHVGETLVGQCRREFMKSLKVSPPWRDQVTNIVQRLPLVYYLGSIISFTLIFTAPIIAFLLKINPQFSTTDQLICILTIMPASYAAVATVNWVTTLFIKPKPWPRMNFSKGVPDTSRTIVVVPAMLSDSATIQKLVADLEIRRLGNRDKNILFALLTDFRDAPHEIEDSDLELLSEAIAAVKLLNQKYINEYNRAPFYLFHRPRLWNDREGVWMGYERKRGKLWVLNQFLRGKARDSFRDVVGDLEQLNSIRYVITLDADTALPRDSARTLIATMAHPLNTPRFDHESRVVKHGYAILQPRVTIHPRDQAQTLFARIFSDDFGIDPYTKTVSDVYQDLFQEGSFIGKGIYDVDAFQKSLEMRFPENRILSHDLIESGFARSGLVSDVQLIEEYPLTYACDAKRRHRWVRGDWQIGSWMLPVVPDGNGQSRLNPLSWVNRWKIFDNVRRSLIPLATVALLLICWFLKPIATTAISTSILSYMLLPQIARLIRPAYWIKQMISARQVLRDTVHSLIRAIGLSLLQIAFLPDETCLAADAALRSMYRMVVSKRRLLEWNPAADSFKASDQTLKRYLRTMWFSLAIGTLALIAFVVDVSHQTWMSLPFAIIWMTAPFIAWVISQPSAEVLIDLGTKQTKFLRSMARLTWSFFDDFTSKEDNWLPPDNYQEYPSEVTAHRTSPTNIGLALLSTLGAFDFGYLPITELVRRIDDTLTTMEKLDRFKGHFYNWYDTQSLIPITPYYISTVDSGNLAGALLTLSQGLRSIAAGNLQSNRLWPGLEDVCYVIDELNSAASATGKLSRAFLDKVQKSINALNISGPKTPDEQRSQTIATLLDIFHTAQSALAREFPIEQLPIKLWMKRLKTQCNQHLVFLTETNPDRESALRQEILNLADRAKSLTNQDYSFLYNENNRLLAIGYQVVESKRDQAYYDLLASEARLASFLAIAKGSIPQEHWFALGRQLGSFDNITTLISWSGSMFEYLMPLLMMPTFRDTLLDQACKNCVSRQIKYGKDRGVPWGISESGYNVTDASDNYQYRAFGVPGLGFKRGLEQDLVIAPYASVMALMVDPSSACHNMELLKSSGYLGRYGFYEAIDFTPVRTPPGEKRVIIRSFMAHHQGMAFLSLTSHLLNQPMQRRLQSDPEFKATELLLRERMPKVRANLPEIFLGADIESPPSTPTGTTRVIRDPNSDTPAAHLLGNGRYHVMVSSSGSGFSTWNNLAITRWREDMTKDAHGFYIYIRDKNLEQSWSAGYQPMLEKSKDYEVIFSEGRAEFRRSDSGIETHTEIAVSPDDDAELRRVTIVNHGPETRVIEVTTYAEVVLAPLLDDLSHPCFSNLFVESEIIGDQEGLICRRRSRVAAQKNPWLFHTMVVHGGSSANDGIETDRAAFIGRNRNPSNPVALTQSLTNSSGAVLDPIIAIRKKISIAAGKSVVIDCALGISEDRIAAVEMIKRFHEKQIADRVFELAWTHGHVLLLQLNCTPSDAIVFGTMAGSLIYGSAALRCDPSIIKSNTKSMPGFWSYGISGDLPIVLVKLQSLHGLKLLETLVKGHDYWRRKGLTVDLVIWNESQSSYRQELHDKIFEVIAMVSSMTLMDKSGGIFLRRPDQMPDEDRVLFQTGARLVVSEDSGTLEDQVTATRNIKQKLPKTLKRPIVAHNPAKIASQKIIGMLGENLFAENGFGGFSADTSEYIIHARPGRSTPMPWVNVIANTEFGTVVSESGSSYTWSENAREHRLTPWFNDPVSDPSGELIYLRDDEASSVWSATPQPCPTSDDYEVRHGFGYTTFQTTTNQIKSTMTMFVAPNAPVKVFKIKLTNQSNVARKISLIAYIEITLGDSRNKTAPHIVTEMDPTLGVLFARNVFATDFRGRVAFLAATEDWKSFTCDRTEFIGRNLSTARPAALERVRLNGRVGALYDPCLAMQVESNLAPGASKEIAFILGAGQSIDDARKIRRQFRSIGSIDVALAEVHKKWSQLLGRINIETPDHSLNLLSNGWLQYQTIASRFLGRSGFYQSGGAYGFRDQLQDAMAIVYCAPELAREHIIRCAGRQFIEGDVQHWWHPPSGRGVRTTISDDLLWLPFVTCHYIKITGDFAILSEIAPYLRAAPLEHGQESNYSQPTVTVEQGDIYEHCVKAINYGLKFGSHGLPLMGSGDWNDGMNLVGHQGKGESVWLGFFLLSIMNNFGALSTRRGDLAFKALCDDKIKELTENIESHAWDGSWYLRAYFDDGTPLGSSKNLECRIDSLPQSWAVLSDCEHNGHSSRCEAAMESVYRHLVDQEGRLIRLFTPPFDQHLPCPGYISGYLPGIRENGGQYTHAAIWVIQAFAKMGDVDRALELLNLINPITHGDSPERIARYKVEPYVVAADVYGVEPHRGQGGWTWYSGSSAWLYRIILESILGFDLQGEKLCLSPKLPTTWNGFRLRYKFRDTEYKIAVKRSATKRDAQRTLLNGAEITGAIPLVNDRLVHTIDIETI